MTTPFNPQQFGFPQQQPQAAPQQPLQQNAVPFNVVANPNQFAQPFQQYAPQQQPPVQSQQPVAQQQPQQPTAQQQQAMQFAQLNQRIPVDPNIPAAFHNRTLKEIIDGFARTAGTLQTLQRQQQVQQPQQPQTFGQQTQQQQQPTQQAPIQTPAGMSMEFVQQAIEAAVARQSLPQIVLQVEQAVAQENAAYRDPAIRQRVKEIMGTVPQEEQAKRAMWDYAVTLAVGERVMQQQQQQGVPSGFVQPTQANAPFVAGQQRPADNYLNANGPAFTEAPTGNTNYSTFQRPPLTQAEAAVAANLGLDPTEVAKYNSKVFGQ